MNRLVLFALLLITSSNARALTYTGEVGTLHTGDGLYYLSVAHLASDYSLSGILAQDVNGDPELTLLQGALHLNHYMDLYAGKTAIAFGLSPATISSYVEMPSIVPRSSSTVRLWQRSLMQPDWSASVDFKVDYSNTFSYTFYRQKALEVVTEGGQSFFLDDNVRDSERPREEDAEEVFSPLRPTNGAIDPYVDGLLEPIFGDLAEELFGVNPFSRPVEIVSSSSVITQSHHIRYEFVGQSVQWNADYVRIDGDESSADFFALSGYSFIKAAVLSLELIATKEFGSFATVAASYSWKDLTPYVVYTRFLDEVEGEEVETGLIWRGHYLALKGFIKNFSGDLYGKGTRSAGFLAISVRI